MFLVSFVLVYLIGSALAVSPHSVGYFAGRSGDIIVQPENAINDNSALLLHGKQFTDIELKTIEDVHVADLFAHVMGTQPFNVLADRTGFPQGDLFNKPKAALLLTLDSISPDVYAKYSAGKDYHRVDLTTSTYPANTHTMLSNLATGTHPSVHGIVSGSWLLPNGETVMAHATTEGAPLAANMADILAQEWSGASLTVSASSSGSMATAFAVNNQFVGTNAFALSVDSGAFESIYTQSARPLSLSAKALQTIFQDSAFSTFLGATKISINNNKITIIVRSNTATFDTNEVDYKLLAELGFVYNLLNALESDSKLSTLVADAVPDFYSIIFSGLKVLKEQYGEQSDVFIVALSLVDNAIQQAVAKFDKLYGGRVVSAVACLDTQTVIREGLKELIFNNVRKYLKNTEDFDLHFPSLYIRGNTGPACTELKGLLGTSAEVHCFASTYTLVDMPFEAPGNGTLPEPKDVPAFWILFFLTLGLFAAILLGVVGLLMAGSDASKDSLLFRSAGRAHAH